MNKSLCVQRVAAGLCLAVGMLAGLAGCDRGSPDGVNPPRPSLEPDAPARGTNPGNSTPNAAMPPASAASQ
jgi:hypothetical protein